MSLQASWVWRGYFDLSAEDPRSNTNQMIRQELCRGLGRLPGSLHMASFPVGPAWPRVFWWREGDAYYAEAQFFMRIVRDHAVLSLGVSVEKGLETPDIGSSDPQRLDRTSWDWQRLVNTATEILTTDVPAAVEALGRPVTVRIRCARSGVLFEDDSHAFSLMDGHWFERNRGTSSVEKIVEQIAAVDQHRDRWAIVFFGIDLDPAAIDQMEPAKVAELLLAFDPVRRRLRGKSHGSEGAA